MNNIDIFEDSINGYRLTSGAPTDKGVDECIRYYLRQLELFDVKYRPEEFAILNYAMGKLLFADKSVPLESEDRAKRVENALFYFNRSLEVFTTKEYPIMYCVISIFMGKLFRERSRLISHRNFLGERSTPEETLQFGVDQVLEAIPILMDSRTHQVEYAVCCAELGYLHLMQSELPAYAEDNYLREQALAYLDRAIGISEKLPAVVLTLIDREKPMRWQPNDPLTFPHHIKLLLEEQSFSYLEGMSFYLMGRLQQGWGTFGTAEEHHDHSNQASTSLLNDHIQQAYDYYCKCVRPKYLKNTSPLWSDAHHRIALLIIRYPALINPDYGNADAEEESSEIHLDSAISHISLALRCKTTARHERMDQYFHLAQTYITKLQRIIDTVPFGESVTKAIIAADGVDLIQNIEENLREALKRVTAANTQSVQDGYLFYFTSLKLAEYRMLEAACITDLDQHQREEYLKDAVNYLVDACASRTLADNVDMHYIASAQLAQVIMAVKRSHAAAKAYAKLLFILSVQTNRWLFSERYVEAKILDDCNRHVSSAIFNAVRGVSWVKLHIGPSRLHERPAAGYASWSFEDIPRRKATSTKMAMLSTISDKALGPGKSNENKPLRPALPKGIPPLNLMQTNLKKVYIAGEDMPDEDIPIAGGASSANAAAFKPPSGAVPLTALGQNFRDDSSSQMDDASIIGDSGLDAEATPYTGRMRSRVPPVKEMRAIDKANRAAFGLKGGKVAYVLPGAHINATDKSKYKNDSPPKKQIKAGVIFADSMGNKNDASETMNEGNDGDVEDDDENDHSENDEDSDAGKEHKGHKEDEEEGNESDESGEEEQEGKKRKRKSSAGSGIFKWMFGKKKAKTEENQGEDEDDGDKEDQPLSKKKSFLSAVFGQLKKAQEQKEIMDEKIENLLDRIGMWASKQAFFALMLHSRQSRMELIVRSKRLNVIDGERACQILYKIKPKYLILFSNYRESLFNQCQELLPPVSNLKEMSGLTFTELQQLFRSHTKIVDRLEEFENFLYWKLSKADYFLPMISTAPIFMRDVSGLDESLLNSDVLTSQMIYEQALPNIRDVEEQKKQEKERELAMQNEAGRNNKHKHDKSKSTHDSVSSAHSGNSSDGINKASKTSSSQPAILGRHRRTEEEIQQEKEEKEAVRAGMMTYSLSQELDGSGYCFNGSQGIKDLLVKHLGIDECMLHWHVPKLPSQNVSCVLVWRENSESLHKHFSAKEAMAARLEDEKVNRRKKLKEKEMKKQQPDKNPKATGANETNKKNKRGDKGENNAPDMKGVVIEFAKCDLQASHLMQFIQRYLDALHSSSAPKRLTESNDALRGLSCALSITELLLMIPPHVRSLVICCPPVLRLIPWHALLFEINKNTAATMGLASASGAAENVIEAHLLEKYCVRMGPTLNIWELSSIAGSSLRQSVGMHRMCCIDGDDRISNKAVATVEAEQTSTMSPSIKPKARLAVGGIRGADLEVASVASTWSADPEDYHILADHAATPLNIETTLIGIGTIEKYHAFKAGTRIVDPYRVDAVPEGDEEQRFAEAQRERQRKALRQLHSKKYRRRLRQMQGEDDDEESSEEESDSEEENEGENGDQRSDARSQMTKKLTKAAVKEQREFQNRRKEHKKHVEALTMCRVLHICANKVPLHENMADKRGVIEAAIQLPEGYDVLEQKNDHLLKLDQGIFSSSDVIHQLYVKNCALCVLSRFGITDDVLTNKSPIMDSNCEFIEAAHLAGACTVIHPLWEAGSQGLGNLASLMFFIRFYSFLPSKSRDRLSIVETVRKTQLWLKDVSANDAIAFIHKAPIPKSAREMIIEEMEAYVKASVASNPLSFAEAKALAASKARAAEETANGGEGSDVVQDGNRPGGARKFFSHYLHWGAFVISGYGGNVHHPNLTEDADEDAAIFGKGAPDDEEELDNIEFEVSVLRMEGKIEEAMALEQRIREIKMERMKKRMNAVKGAGFKAGRGVLDFFDFLDKALLDQDSDEVSVSDEEDNEDDHEHEDDDHNPTDKNGAKEDPATPQNKRQSLFQPHEFDYGKWKGRVTSLNMNVALPSLPTPDKKKEKLAALRSKMVSPSPNRADNYEFNMMKKMQSNAIHEEDEQDEEKSDDSDNQGGNQKEQTGGSDDEEDYEGLDPDEIRRLKALRARERAKKQAKALKAIRGGVRSYGEIALMLADRIEKKAHELPVEKLKLDLDAEVEKIKEKVNKDKCSVS